MRQRERLGMVPMTLLYVFVFFPVCVAYGRAVLEREAYAESMLATAEYDGLDAVTSQEYRSRYVGRFTGGSYGWMWVFRSMVERWYDEALVVVKKELHGDKK